jgi:hypothetical protein
VGILGVAAMVGKWMGRGVDGEMEPPKWGRRRESWLRTRAVQQLEIKEKQSLDSQDLYAAWSLCSSSLKIPSSKSFW